MKILILISLIIISSITVISADLSDYPNFLDKGENTSIYVIKGATQSSTHAIAGLDIISTLPRELYNKVYSKLDTDKDINLNSDLILIGGPCSNQITKKFVDDPSDCNQGAEEGKAVVKLIGNGQNVLLIVAATNEEYREVGKAILNQKLSGKETRLNLKKKLKEEETIKKEERKKQEFNDRAEQVEKGDCSGCVTENGCLLVGDLTSVNGKPHFCNDKNDLQMQKDVGGSCGKHVECTTGYCKSEKCKKQNIFVRTWRWFKNLLFF